MNTLFFFLLQTQIKMSYGYKTKPVQLFHISNQQDYYGPHLPLYVCYLIFFILCTQPLSLISFINFLYALRKRLAGKLKSPTMHKSFSIIFCLAIYLLKFIIKTLLSLLGDLYIIATFVFLNNSSILATTHQICLSSEDCITIFTLRTVLQNIITPSVNLLLLIHCTKLKLSIISSNLTYALPILVSDRQIKS